MFSASVHTRSPSTAELALRARLLQHESQVNRLMRDGGQLRNVADAAAAVEAEAKAEAKAEVEHNPRKRREGKQWTRLDIETIY